MDSARLADLLGSGVLVEWAPQHEYGRLIIELDGSEVADAMLPMLIDGTAQLLANGEPIIDYEERVEFIITDRGADYTWFIGSPVLTPEFGDLRKSPDVKWELLLVSEPDFTSYLEECDCRSLWQGELRIPVTVSFLP